MRIPPHRQIHGTARCAVGMGAPQGLIGLARRQGGQQESLEDDLLPFGGLLFAELIDEPRGGVTETLASP